jgi:methionine-rich copper-binding protein CopC
MSSISGRRMAVWTRRVAVVLSLSAAIPLVAATNGNATERPHPNRFHLALTKADPKVNDTVSASPKTITLWFTETIKAAGTTVRLTGPGAKAVHVGAVTVASTPMAPAIVAVSETLKPGTYTVTWRALADDGDPSSGKFKFTVRPSGE